MFIYKLQYFCQISTVNSVSLSHILHMHYTELPLDARTQAKQNISGRGGEHSNENINNDSQ